MSFSRSYSDIFHVQTDFNTVHLMKNVKNQPFMWSRSMGRWRTGREDKKSEKGRAGEEGKGGDVGGIASTY